MNREGSATHSRESHADRRASHSGGRRRRAFVAVLLLAAGGLLAIWAWSELHPRALAESEKAYRQNRLEAAMRGASAYLAQRPGNRQANLMVARCLSRLGKPQEAITYYDRAGSLSKEDSHIRAFAWVLHNSRQSAIDCYREHLGYWPQDVLALSRLAAVQFSESQWSETLETARRLIEIPDGEVIGLTLAGIVQSRTGETEDAIAKLSRVLELDPELKRMPLKPRSMFWADLTKNLLLMGRAEEAMPLLERGLQESNDASLADLLGQAYYLRGVFDEADRYWRLALQWEPGRYGTWWRLGKLELQRGRLTEAAELIKRSSEIEPGAVGPLYSLSRVYRLLGRTQESDELNKKANSLRGQVVRRTRSDAEDVLSRIGNSATQESPREPQPATAAPGPPSSL